MQGGRGNYSQYPTGGRYNQPPVQANQPPSYSYNYSADPRTDISKPMSEDERHKKLVLEKIERELQARRAEREREMQMQMERERELQRREEQARIEREKRMYEDQRQREQQQHEREREREIARAALARQVERELREKERREHEGNTRGQEKTNPHSREPARSQSSRKGVAPAAKSGDSPRSKESSAPRKSGASEKSEKPYPFGSFSIIPMYLSLAHPNHFFCDIRRRFPRMKVAHDFTHLKVSWLDGYQEQIKSLPLHTPLHFTKSIDNRELPAAQPTTSSGAHKWQSKVILVSGFDRSQIRNIILGEGNIFNMFEFIVGRGSQSKGGGLFCVGGTYQKDLDGPSPETNPDSLIKTAIRTCKELTEIDLSVCTQWIRFLDLEYHRPEETIKGIFYPPQSVTTVIWVPNIWNHIPSLEEAMKTYNHIHPLPAELADIKEADSEKMHVEQSNSNEEKSSENETKTEAKAETAEDSAHKKTEVTKSTIAEIKAQLMADMKAEFAALLIAGDVSKVEELLQKKIEEKFEAMKMEEREKIAEKAQKQQEETKKKKLEHELSLQPKRPCVVFSRREDAKVNRVSVSTLSSLLEYSSEDVLEKTFEVSIFAEFFVEMLQYRFGTVVYDCLSSFARIHKEEEEAKKLELEKKKKEDDEAKAKAKEESDKKAKEEAERKAKEEEEEAEKKKKEEAEQKLKEQDVQVKSELDEENKLQTEISEQNTEVQQQKTEEIKNSVNEDESVPMVDETTNGETSKEHKEIKEEKDNSELQDDFIPLGSPSQESKKKRPASDDGNEENSKHMKLDHDEQNKQENSNNNDNNNNNNNDNNNSNNNNNNLAESISSTNKEEIDPVKRIAHDDLMLAFSFFDVQRLGYLSFADISHILHSIGLCVSHRQMVSLISPAVTHNNRVYYRGLIGKVVGSL